MSADPLARKIEKFGKAADLKAIMGLKKGTCGELSRSIHTLGRVSI
jgi:hypothetical protein